MVAVPELSCNIKSDWTHNYWNIKFSHKFKVEFMKDSNMFLKIQSFQFATLVSRLIFHCLKGNVIATDLTSQINTSFPKCSKLF